jgi:hypothetical protein
MQISFNTESPNDVAFVRTLLGMPAPAAIAAAAAAPASTSASTPAPVAVVAPAGRPVPAWAPAGSSWVPMPGAPMLQGPDGAVIAVQWVGATALPGALSVNHDAAAEALGQLSLADTRGAA